MKLNCIIIFVLLAFSVNGQSVIKVIPHAGDMTKSLQQAIDEAKTYNGKLVTIELQNGDYDISRANSSQILYHISNTASEEENPDQTKHIGLWFKDMKNVTLDGRGARLITHGEMTTFVVDNCENITLKNFILTADDPTVPELSVVDVEEHSFIAQIHPQSTYSIDGNGKLTFTGHGWRLSGGIAQTYDPILDITWRSWSPFDGLQKVEEIAPHRLRFVYASPLRDVKKGWVFQMRDAIRDEACALIQQSKRVRIENAQLSFLGNFGIVVQLSQDVTYSNLTFAPEYGSGRTCSGFADFVQMSGCKGKLRIENSYFSGAHDDPINIHGTHLQVMEYPADNQILVKYMHNQTYGFQSFFSDDCIEFIHPNTLMPAYSAKVKKAEMKNAREILITLTRKLPQHILNDKKYVVENVTYTPEVEIVNNYFSRIPTRGILVSTRRKVVIEDNVFFRMQMSGILIADDARSWYESGMVKEVTIQRNQFVECGSPVISISPENNENGGYVHSHIKITDNRFVLKNPNAIFAKSVDGLLVKNNYFITPSPAGIDKIVVTRDCDKVVVENNLIR